MTILPDIGPSARHGFTFCASSLLASAEQYRVTRSALILSHDAVAAALIGGSAELAGLAPAYPRRSESVRAAVRRLRPACLLADCEQDDASVEAFIGPAMMMGARVVVFCPARDAEAITRARRLAQRYGIAFFQLPDHSDRLQSFLNDVAAAATADAPRSGNSR